MINFSFSKHKAFTLAEVLITLGIIGVIAALTTPALWAQAGRAKIGPEIAKVQTTISEGVQLFLNDNNAEFLSIAMKKNGIEEPTITNLFSECLAPNAYKELSSAHTGYIRAEQREGAPTTSLKWNGEEGGYGGEGQAYELVSGGVRFVIEKPDCAFSAIDSYCGIIVLTTSLNRSTRTSGTAYVTGGNVFKLYLLNNGTVYPDGTMPGLPYWDETGYCSSEGIEAGTDSGFGCAGRISVNGWKVKY